AGGAVGRSGGADRAVALLLRLRRGGSRAAAAYRDHAYPRLVPMDHGTLSEEHVLRLRPMEPPDAATFTPWGQDAAFCRAAGWREGLPEGELMEFWDALITSPPQTLHRLSATVDDAVVGYVDLHGTDPEVLELGYVIGPSARWGQGLGTAAARLGLRYGFTVL